MEHLKNPREPRWDDSLHVAAHGVDHGAHIADRVGHPCASLVVSRDGRRVIGADGALKAHLEIGLDGLIRVGVAVVLTGVFLVSI